MGRILRIFAVFNIILSFSFSFAATKTLTLADWKTFSDEDRQLYAEGYGDDNFLNLKVISIDLDSNQDLSSILDPIAQQFAYDMKNKMEDESTLEVQDDYYALVGPTYISSITVLVLDGTTALGGSISYYQQGCMMADETSPYFETEEEAKQAGCDLGADVSWQSHGTFDYDLSIFSITGYMEWSGH